MKEFISKIFFIIYLNDINIFNKVKVDIYIYIY